MNWLERARLEIPKSAVPPTANSDERTLTAVVAVPQPVFSEKTASSKSSIGSNGSAQSGQTLKLAASESRPRPLAQSEKSALLAWLASIVAAH